MAFAFLKDLTFTASSDKNSSSTWQPVYSIAVPARSQVIIAIGIDNIATTDATGGDILSVTDSAGNLYYRAAEQTNGNAAPAAGVTASMWWSFIANPIIVGTVLTITFSANTTAKGIIGSAWSGAGGYAVQSGGRVVDAASSGSVFPNAAAIETPASQKFSKLYVAIQVREVDAATQGLSAGNTTLPIAHTTGGTADTNVWLSGYWRIRADGDGGNFLDGGSTSSAAADCASVGAMFYETGIIFDGLYPSVAAQDTAASGSKIGFINANVGASASSWTTAAATQNIVANSSLAVLILATDNISTTDGNHNEHLTLVDSAGNTYTKGDEFTNSNGAAAAGSTCSIWWAILTNPIVSGSTTFTATFSANTTAKALTSRHFSLAASGVKVIVEATTHTVADATNIPGTISITPASVTSHLMVRGIAAETDETVATGGVLFTKTSFASVSPTHFLIAFRAASFGTGSNPTSMSATGEFGFDTSTDGIISAVTTSPTPSDCIFNTSIDSTSVGVLFSASMPAPIGAGGGGPRLHDLRKRYTTRTNLAF